MHGKNKTKLVLIECACCHKWQVVRLDPEDFERHANGLFVQFAFTEQRDTVSHTGGKRTFHLGVLRIVLGLALPTRSLTRRPTTERHNPRRFQATQKKEEICHRITS